MEAKIPGNHLTTAMEVRPHTDVTRALAMSLLLDVPFWPQLPNYSYYGDMYVLLVNPDKERTVERAFGTVKQMADTLRDKYQE